MSVFQRCCEWIAARISPFDGALHSLMETDPEPNVRLKCPETDATIATEYTVPIKYVDDVDGGTCITSYECDECGGVHRFLWGPPAPIRLSD